MIFTLQIFYIQIFCNSFFFCFLSQELAQILYTQLYLHSVLIQAFFWDSFYNSGGFRVNEVGFIGSDDIKYASSITDDKWLYPLGFCIRFRVYSFPFVQFFNIDLGTNLSHALQVGLGLQAIVLPSIIIASFSLYSLLSTRKSIPFLAFAFLFLINGMLINFGLSLLRESLVCLFVTLSLLSFYRSSVSSAFIYISIVGLFRPLMGLGILLFLIPINILFAAKSFKLFVISNPLKLFSNLPRHSIPFFTSASTTISIVNIHSSSNYSFLWNRLFKT